MHRSIARAVIMGGVLMMLSACATTMHYRNATHPEYGQTEFDRDWYECQKENTGPVASSYVYGYARIAGSDTSLVVNEEMARQCLAARGWRPVTSSTLESPPSPAPRTAAASTIQPDERARTERLQRLAREALDKRYNQAPYACNDGGWWSWKNYVIDVAPWAEAAGLRKGDRLLAFGPISLAQYDSASEAWSKVPGGTDVTVRVDRAGKEVSIQFPCRGDNSEVWRAKIAVLRAVADAQWQTCLDAVQTLGRILRVTPSGELRLARECMRERAKAAAQRPPDAYWRMVHAWATKAVEEARYLPTGLTEVRSELLDAADALEKADRPTWASDIRQQIATFSLAPASP